MRLERINPRCPSGERPYQGQVAATLLRMESPSRKRSDELGWMEFDMAQVSVLTASARMPMVGMATLTLPGTSAVIIKSRLQSA
jgi:hypothetical protein